MSLSPISMHKVASSQTADIAILGAGIQGICCALALARRGRRVCLIDAAPEPLLRTSKTGEGKIHLGFVYAKDASLRTARLMLHAAMRFAPLLDGWLASSMPDLSIPWENLRSRPFAYGIMPDSQLAHDELVECYAHIQQLWDDLRGHDNLHYLGTHPQQLWQNASPAPWQSHVAPNQVAHWIDTAEYALETGLLRRWLMRAVQAHPHITTCFGQRVTGVERTSWGFRTTSSAVQPNHATRRALVDLQVDSQFDSQFVINCLWDSRLEIDVQLGLAPPRAWNYRLKYSLRGQPPAALWDLPSMTLVLGGYGDLVFWPQRKLAYLSWYPTCMQGWSETISPPAAMRAAAAGHIDHATQAEIAATSLAALDRIIPGIDTFDMQTVSAGIIFAWGESDIYDPASALHQRADTGPSFHDGYCSINTGKFTTAPFFAQQVADHLAGKPHAEHYSAHAVSHPPA